MRYVQVNQPNVPARTRCRHGLYAIAIAIARTNVPLSSAHAWTLFHHPPGLCHFTFLIAVFVLGFRPRRYIVYSFSSIS